MPDSERQEKSAITYGSINTRCANCLSGVPKPRALSVTGTGGSFSVERRANAVQGIQMSPIKPSRSRRAQKPTLKIDQISRHGLNDGRS
jgi:hypothetical protein